MHSTSDGRTLFDPALTQRNITIYTAILVAVPTAYAFHVWSGAEAGDFLSLSPFAASVGAFLWTAAMNVV